MENVLKLIHESRKLIDYVRCMAMVTGYKAEKFDRNNYTRLLQEAEKEVQGAIKHDSKERDNG